MIYVGIDPGFSGAIALIDIIRNETMIWDIPTQPKPRSTKREIDESRLCQMVEGLLSRVPSPLQVECALEDVHAMPGQGVTSMFAFGTGFGILRGALSMARIPYKRVAPQTWKKYHGLLGAEKDDARALALKGYPFLEPLLARKKDIGRADAMLIADFARARRGQ